MLDGEEEYVYVRGADEVQVITQPQSPPWVTIHGWLAEASEGSTVAGATVIVVLQLVACFYIIERG